MPNDLTPLVPFNPPLTLDVWFDKGTKRRFSNVVDMRNEGNNLMMLYIGEEQRQVLIN